MTTGWQYPYQKVNTSSLACGFTPTLIQLLRGCWSVLTDWIGTKNITSWCWCQQKLTSPERRWRSPGWWCHTWAGSPWLLCSRLWWWCGSALALLCPAFTHIHRNIFLYNHFTPQGGNIVQTMAFGCSFELPFDTVNVEQIQQLAIRIYLLQSS